MTLVSLRRKLQGSEPPLSDSLSSQITESSSVQRLEGAMPACVVQRALILCCMYRPISDSNVGHQLLSRMGWEEGTGLGRTGQGQTEPVST